MDEIRQSPERFLKQIEKEEQSLNRGHLKIFFGYAAGVGKTYAMLKAAHSARKRGIDVVAGYVEPHDRPQTSALINGLECLPNLVTEYNGIVLSEFNLDAALVRHPQLILVDELAHTNAPLCRHTKRYQDIQELLNAGIDVYTTVKAVAEWVQKNNKHAGATTETLSNAKCLYLSIRVNSRVYGVVGIYIGEEPLDSFEKSILLSILGECALSLENEKNAREKEEAAILAKNEQLRANLLRAISHDLRTPLTSISGNASNLLSNGNSFDETTKKQLYSDIYDDSMWLINLVENLLSVTRLDEGRLNLNITEDLVDDVISEALHHVNRKSVEHHISVHNKEEYLLAKMDAKLMVQVIINMVDNAIKYTPKGSNILIKTWKHGDKAVISIADDGDGIPDDMKERVFDMFYSGANNIADSRRSLGLGLSLCRSIVNAHGGKIEVSDNTPHGAVFTITLSAGEVKIHE